MKSGIPIATSCALLLASMASGQTNPKVTIDWNQAGTKSKTTPTLQVVVNPPLRHGEPLSIASFKALKELGAHFVRYVPWLPYPRLAVAELEPPTSTATSWAFSLIDPTTTDFLEATKGHPTVMNFSTIPAWIFKTEKPVTYPANPIQPIWNYSQGTELRDPSGKELAGYFERLVSWYVNGGFTDENGVKHHSGYHFKFPIWEVLNEPDLEHQTSPEQYTKRYDAIVEGIRKASPKTKFMGLGIAIPKDHLDFFKYFLNSANHKPGIPLDYISYHFYASPSPSQNIGDWQHTFFDQADGFLKTVQAIEVIRKQESPSTKSALNELGVILPTDNGPTDNVPPPKAYWNLAGSMYAYLFVELSRLGIDIVGESQLVGYPTQFPSVSMMNWVDNKPNARFWVLKLTKDNVHPGDAMIDANLTGGTPGDIEAQAYRTRSGNKLLLINKRDRAIDVEIPDAEKASMATVDESTGDGPAKAEKVTGNKVRLEPFAVSVVTYRR